jgi:uncharacterized glyoxalase superfamily metalloenzyme YdcJ
LPESIEAPHARFGEIEQRGVALTPKAARCTTDCWRGGVGKDNLSHQRHLQEVFSPFPDSEFCCVSRGWRGFAIA